MQEMPKEWQDKMAELLYEYDKAMVNPPDLGTRVQITKNEKLVATPEWILSYRRPERHRETINHILGR